MQIKNLAVGYFENESFREVCAPYLGRISEVFFGWPGILNCRSVGGEDSIPGARLVEELRWSRGNGLRLDALFNCNCYGDHAMDETMKSEVLNALEAMGGYGLLPDVVTTTSPFVAQIIRETHPRICLRASVNMRIHGSIGFEACAELFDEYYVSRERQRDFAYMEGMRQWALQNGKRLGMQVNSGCIRQCPYQTFHDNLHGHQRQRQMEAGRKIGFELFCCRKRLQDDHAYEDILKGTWVRPEDTCFWEPYVSFLKLSTRRVPFPEKIIRAYAERHFAGNLLEILDPMLSQCIGEYEIANERFPSNWAQSGIGGACANDCTHCGRCRMVLEQILEGR